MTDRRFTLPPRVWLEADQGLPFVQEALETSLVDTPLAAAAAHHFRRPGKLARARLALATCAAMGVDRESSIRLALACEQLHNASLVHDDVQDRDAERRGQASVWQRFGDPMAINLGDYLLTAAIHTASSIEAAPERRLALVQAFTGATLAVIRGQVADTGDEVRSLTRYEAVAQAKTGPLLALPIEGALILAGIDEAHGAVVREAMGQAGTAFQIRDDVLDLRGGKQRPLGADLRAGRPNAGLLHFLEALPAPERARIGFGARNDDEVRALLRRIAGSQALERCARHVEGLREMAHATATRLPAPLAVVVHFAIDALVQPLELEAADAAPVVTTAGRRVSIPVSLEAH